MKNFNQNYCKLKLVFSYVFFFFLVLFFRDPMIPSDDPIRWSDPGFVDAELK